MSNVCVDRQKEFQGDPRYVEISPDIIQEDLGFAPKDCLRNSYTLATHHDNTLLVEGLVLTLCSGNVISIVPHCWNKYKAQYVDTSKDFIWETEWFKQKLYEVNGDGEYTYKYLLCSEYPVSDCYYDSQEDKFSFHFTYENLITYINEQLKND